MYTFNWSLIRARKWLFEGFNLHSLSHSLFGTDMKRLKPTSLLLFINGGIYGLYYYDELFDLGYVNWLNPDNNLWGCFLACQHLSLMLIMNLVLTKIENLLWVYFSKHSSQPRVIAVLPIPIICLKDCRWVSTFWVARKQGKGGLSS